MERHRREPRSPPTRRFPGHLQAATSKIQPRRTTQVQWRLRREIDPVSTVNGAPCGGPVACPCLYVSLLRQLAYGRISGYVNTRTHGVRSQAGLEAWILEGSA